MEFLPRTAKAKCLRCWIVSLHVIHPDEFHRSFGFVGFRWQLEEVQGINGGQMQRLLCLLTTFGYFWDEWVVFPQGISHRPMV